MSTYFSASNQVSALIDPYNLKYADQAVQHLQAKEYADAWAIWLECKRLVESHLEKIVKMWESIEQRLASNIPKVFIEWDARGIAPLTCHILDNTVPEICRETEWFKARGNFEETYFKKYKEKDYFKVGGNSLCKKSRREFG